MFYLLWRVMCGRHKSITLSFMVAGHTKFSCDRHFGLIKKRYIRSKIDTMMDLERVVQESSQGYNVSEIVKSDSVEVFNWVKYFNSLGFVSIPNILKYH